jgi:hypothetical protein
VHDEDAILSSLPQQLKQEVVSSIVNDNLAQFNFFTDKPHDFTAAVLNHVNPELFVARYVVLSY